MRETDLDILLQTSLPEQPPDQVAAQINPWRKIFHRVLIGLALTSVTFRVFNLDYILPAIGVLLIFLGSRSLRRENRHFMLCWILSILRGMLFGASLIWNAFLHPEPLPRQYEQGFLWLTIAVQLLFCVALWRGLLAVQKKAAIPHPHARSAAALFIWSAVLASLSLLQAGIGMLASIGMLLAFFCILVCIHRISGSLDEIGYLIHPASIHFSDWGITAAAVVVVGCSMLCGLLLQNQYPMDWTPQPTGISAEEKAIYTHLLDLGFPEAVLRDLDPTELTACANATQVIVKTNAYSFNKGGEISVHSEGGAVYTDVYSVKELAITDIAVHLSGEKPTWKIFHHFVWTTQPPFFGTESIQLWPTYRDLEEGWSPLSDITGKILYDSANGMSYTAPYYFLGNQSFINNSPFGTESRTDVFAAFSLPKNGQRQRGYLTYSVRENAPGYLINSWINYTHQCTPFQYPAETAMEHQMRGNWTDDGPFITKQDQFMFHPDDGRIE